MEVEDDWIQIYQWLFLILHQNNVPMMMLMDALPVTHQNLKCYNLWFLILKYIQPITKI